MARLIDADALKKAFCEWCGSAASLNPDEVCGRTCGTLDFFDAQPTVTAEPKRWIPCSERLPEQTGRYLVWLDSEIVDIAEFCTYADFVPKELANNYWNKASKVLYWMPLPESTESPEIRARDDDYTEF